MQLRISLIVSVLVLAIVFSVQAQVVIRATTGDAAQAYSLIGGDGIAGDILSSLRLGMRMRSRSTETACSPAQLTRVPGSLQRPGVESAQRPHQTERMACRVEVDPKLGRVRLHRCTTRTECEHLRFGIVEIEHIEVEV